MQQNIILIAENLSRDARGCMEVLRVLVTANLTQWCEQKQGLLQLLRKHPLWNEKELAIVFRVEERREIDRITVDETRAAILELGRRACTDDTVYENFEISGRAD